LLAIGVMVGLGGLIVAAVAMYTLNVFVEREGNLFTRANQQYKDGKFAVASRSYQELADEFPQSENAPTYRFLADLSDLRDQASSDAELAETAARIHEFLEKHQGDPLLHEHRQDVHTMLSGLADHLLAVADHDTSLPLLEKARAVLDESEHYPVAKGTESDVAATKAKFAEVSTAITRRVHRQQFISGLKQRASHVTSLEDAKRAREAARREGLDQDDEARALLTGMESEARARIRYVPLSGSEAPQATPAHEPSILVAPRLDDGKHALPPGNRVVLALARGVLYALEQNTGEIMWAERVGVDTTALPVRLPRTPFSPELFLVVSAEQKALLALTARDGRLLWRYKLNADCLGRPLVVGRRVYVPTYDGKVHEIETVSGHCLGYYEVGQPLSVGGVQQPGTDLLYFPADSDYLYVLDAALTNAPNQPPRCKQCVAVLHTGHPSGSLRNEPIVINRLDPELGAAGSASSWPPYLILTQAAGGDRVKLRVFGLPINDSAAPSLLNPEPDVRGHLWFRPYFDDEKIAFATDRGMVGLFGINQVRNFDSPLFREIQGEIQLDNSAAGPVRAQVAHAVDNDFWIIANSSLQRYHLDIIGQRLKPVWPAALHLGSPLHAAQVDEAGTMLTIVSHDLNRDIYLATAVDLEHGVIRWQRELGLEIGADPIALAGGVVVADRAGSLFHFTDARTPLQPGRNLWWKADSLRVKPSGGEKLAVTMMPADDGQSVLQLICPENGTHLVLRKFQPHSDETSKNKLEEHVFELTSPLAGAPVRWGTEFLVPLADGTIRRLTLGPGTSTTAGGPDWRSRRALADATCYIIPLNGTEFLTTDGIRGLSRWRWRQGEGFQSLPISGELVLELPARIVAAPVLLRPTATQEELRLAVADSDGNLRLLVGDDLRAARVWNLGGKITGGPHLLENRLACVVDRSKLVLLDPGKEAPIWTFSMPGEGIVGTPARMDNMIMLADVSGRFLGLDVETGKPMSKGYLLKATAAPVAAPAPLNKNEALVPLTDGTLFLLPLKALRGS
jgi:outer membrane protein assembly factor BamB